MSDIGTAIISGAGQSAGSGDGSQAKPWATLTSGQDGLDEIEATHSISDGDYAVIDSDGTPVLFKAIDVSGDIVWVRPWMYEGEDWGSSVIDTFTEDNYSDWVTNGNGRGTVDYDTTVADRIAISNDPGEAGTMTLLSNTARPTASDAFFIINERFKFTSDSFDASTLLRNQVNSTSGGVRLQADGYINTTNWSLEVTAEVDTGIALNTEKTLETYALGGINKMIIFVDREAVPTYSNDSSGWNWDSTSIAKIGYISLTNDATNVASFKKSAYGKLSVAT